MFDFKKIGGYVDQAGELAGKVAKSYTDVMEQTYGQTTGPSRDILFGKGPPPEQAPDTAPPGPFAQLANIDQGRALWIIGGLVVAYVVLKGLKLV